MLTFSLPSDLEEYVTAKVQSGEYFCAAEVIVHGLYLLQDQDTLRQIKLDRLRKEVAIGIEAADRGELAPLDIEEIIAKGRKRLMGDTSRNKIIYSGSAGDDK
jgi:antitoxin ParD1/3/4